MIHTLNKFMHFMMTQYKINKNKTNKKQEQWKTEKLRICPNLNCCPYIK